MLSSYLDNTRRIRREAWIVLFAAIALGFTWMGLSDAVVNLYLVRMGFGPTFVGASAAAANLGYALASIPGAALTRRIGARRGMIVGTLVWVGGAVLLSLSDLVPASLTEAWITLTRLAASGGLALHAVSSQPYLTVVTDAPERPLAFALVISLRPLGGFFGSLVGGFLPGLFVRAGSGPLMATLSQPRPFGLTLAVGMLVYAPVVWALWTLPWDAPERAVPRRGAGSAGAAVNPAAEESRDDVSWTRAAWDRLAARSRRAPLGVLAAIALVCFLRVGGEFTARTFFSVYADARWSIPAAQIGGAIAVASLLSIPAPLVTPALVARFGRAPVVAAGAAGVAASIGLLAVGGTWATATAAFIGLTVLAALARSVWSLVIQESVHDVWRPSAAAVANLFSGLGTMVMSSAGGVLAAGLGYQATFATSAGLVALGAVTVWLSFRGRLEG